MKHTDVWGIGILYGILGVVLFSAKAVLVKLAYQYDIDSLSLLLLRMLFSLPFYLATLFWVNKKNHIAVTKKEWLWVILFGFLGYYLASLFDFMGLQYLKAGIERIILFIYPTIVVLLSRVFLKERISRIQITAIVITYFGVILAFWDELTIAGDAVLWGGFLILSSAITYAAYIVGSGWLIPKIGVLRFTCYAMLVSTCCVVLHYSVLKDWQIFEYDPEVYGYALAMAILATLIPSFLVSASIKRIKASNFSILGSLGPISTIILAFVFLDEELTYLQLLAMFVVISGVTYLSMRRRMSKKYTE